MKYNIPLSIPNFSGKEEKYVLEVLKQGWVSTGGAKITEFEKAVAEFVNVKYGAAVQNGTAGIFLALKALGVGKDDEVIVPTLTFIAAVNPVKYCNAEPIFMDCDNSLCLDARKVEEFCEKYCDFDGKVLRNKKTGNIVKAIIAVHIFGNMCDMENLVKTAKKFKLKLVEDSTEALGTHYLSGKFSGKFAGTIGDIGVYSFNGNKIITTGGGGMIVSNDKKLIEKCRHLSTQAKKDSLYFVHDEIGYNFRLTNVQAALGIAQIEQIKDFIKTKNINYDYYVKSDIKLLPFKENIFSNKWFYSYLTKNKNDRDFLLSYLNSLGIQVRPLWALIHKQKPYSNSQKYKISKAHFFQDRVVNLPCSTNLPIKDIEIVAKEIKKSGF